MSGSAYEADSAHYMARPRINALLKDAVKHPLTVVCAGAGYGKSRAVYDFVKTSGIAYTWMQLSELDNAGSRFWAKYVPLAVGWDAAFAERCRCMGFPDTEDKINRYLDFRLRYAPPRPRIFVLDDVHLVRHPDILRFLERRLREAAKNTSLVFICRELPEINLANLQVRGLIPNINEEDLCFTESELGLYLSRQGVPVQKQNLREIMRDTNGWAFSVNLIARSLKKAPGYAGYVRVAMRRNIFMLMETEAFDAASEKTRRFLVRLSLIDHLSAELVTALAEGDAGLLDELKLQNAYIRFDSGTNAYLIHNLFLDFLRGRQGILTEAEVFTVYATAADWCRRNGFEIDALGYLERIKDYAGIIGILSEQPVQLPIDIAQCAAGIFGRGRGELAESVELYAVWHVRVTVRLGRWQEALELTERYEERFSRLPEDDVLRNRTMGAIYHSRGHVRALLCTVDGRCDFDGCYAKMERCLKKAPLEPGQYAEMPIGFWASLVGSSRAGAPQEYIDAAARAEKHLSRCWRNGASGLELLCKGELMFYRGEIKPAETVFSAVQSNAGESGQFEVENKALFYLLRVAMWQGSQKKALNILRRIEALQEQEGYDHRYLNCDAAQGWYYLGLQTPELVPAWLKEGFAPYSHAYFIENLGNQIKARYHYQQRNYPLLLAYIECAKRRETILYGRVELLALEACARYRMKEKALAFKALEAAWKTAAPNGIIAPFIELGKDMRTLAAAAQRQANGNCRIEHVWLETVKRRASSFAKYRSLMIAYGQNNGGAASLSPRETEVLRDLYHGLSRSEIAARQSLSINTVNSAVNNIFNKLDAHGIADIVRIAAEKKLV